jgi:hypothetical protein
MAGVRFTELQSRVWPKNACGLALVVLQQPAKPLATLQWACTNGVLADRRKEQHIVFALMVALVMIMLHILVKHMP